MFQTFENPSESLFRFPNTEKRNKSLEFEAGYNPNIDSLFLPMNIEFSDFEDTIISYIDLQ